MPDTTNTNKAFPDFDAMSTEELMALLRRDFTLPEGESDTDTVLRVLEALERREREDPSGQRPDVKTAWADFQAHYMPAAPRGKRPKRLVRAACIAAAVAVLLMGTAYAAGALGWLPGWDSDIFWFSRPEETAEALPAVPEQDIASLEEALAYYDAPDNMIPSYIPEGYEAEGFECYTTAMGNIWLLSMWCASDGSTICLDYILYGDNDGMGHYSKDEGEPEIYIAGGVEHYVMTNVGKYMALWQRGDFECSLSGFSSREELIKTIDSMYTEEEP